MNRTEIAEQVLAYCTSEGIAREEDLRRVEAVVREQVRAMGAQALELHLAGRRLGQEGSWQRCPCGGAQRLVEHRPKHVATWLGTLALRRAYDVCPAGRAPVWP